jgi:hypothetical protein
MDLRSSRIAVPALAMATAFAIIVLVLLRIIPPPRRETDYLVIGTVATFGALAILFLILVATVRRSSPVAKKKD